MAELLIELRSSSGFLCELFLLLELRTLIRLLGFEPRREKWNPFLALIKNKMFAPILLFWVLTR